MSTLQALIIAILQGVTELFPVSSLGHAVILPKLLGWSIDQHGPTFLPFLVVLHLGTAAALLVYFWRDWLGLALAFFRPRPLEQRRSKGRPPWPHAPSPLPPAFPGLPLPEIPT